MINFIILTHESSRESQFTMSLGDANHLAKHSRGNDVYLVEEHAAPLTRSDSL